MDLSHAKPRAVDERRVVVLVEEDVIVAAHERRERAEACLIAGGEDERRLFLEERGEPFLELVVKIQRAVQKTAAGGSRTVSQRGALGCLEQLGMMSEPQVVVRADHDL